MKEFNKEKELNGIKINNFKKYSFIGLLFLIMVFVISLVFIFNSYAVFKINKEIELIDTTVGSFEVFELVEDFSYVAGTQNYTIELSGYYQIEAWGSRGSNNQQGSYAGGNGGYISGYKYFEAGDILYVTMGYGGAGGIGDRDYGGLIGGAGGGATDFRIGGTTFDDRIMTAGGGGGAGGGSAGQPGGLAAYSNGFLAYGTAGNYIGWYGGGGAGGGGGGYYGGNELGGYSDSCCRRENGGGGGSSHATEVMENVVFNDGVNNGSGKAKITYVGPTIN